MTAEATELCHLFMMVSPGAPERLALEAVGLRESFRREHPGQGTCNVCYCFENAYLELLWVTDPQALRSAVIAPTGLSQRAAWRSGGASPFGVGLRRGQGGLTVPTWDFAPPYLPPGLTIPVARASDDLCQPFVFLSPGGTRPDQWSDGRSGQRQQTAGLTDIAGAELTVAGVPAPDLTALLAPAGIRLRQGPAPALRITLTGPGSGRILDLPAFRWGEI